MKKVLLWLENFIEEHGLSLFLTLASGAVLFSITVVSWLWPDIYTFIHDNHVFEAVVLAMLVEVIALLTARRASENDFKVLEEREAQEMIFHITEQRAIDRVRILSSGLHSRQFLTGNLIKSGIKVETLVQDPESAIDKRDIRRIYQSIDWIKTETGDKFFDNFDIRFHINVASLRAVVLYEAHSNIRHVFVGWYIYSDNNSSVRGSPNPTIYISTRSKRGEKVYKWVEAVMEKDTRESQVIDLEDLEKLMVR